jgi:nucleoside-diphosphate-sugar epimerase
LFEERPTPSLKRILVTGISGNLGRRLAPLLESYELVSVDLYPPVAGTPVGKFIQLDLSSEAGQQEVAQIVESEPLDAILHLAFVIDPVRTGILDVDRMWQANVAATQHLLEAVACRNREATRLQLFVFPSSVSAYGPELLESVREDATLQAHTLPYAIHKREADLICQQIFPKLGGCAMYIYRPHIYAGATVDNFILRAIRGKPSGRSWLARAYEKRGWKVPALLPKSGDGGALQFVHVDDVARVLLWTLHNFRPGQLQIFNLAGSGSPMTFGECARLAGTPIKRLGSVKQIHRILTLFWKIGLSGVPPESIPYYLTNYTMDTRRLETELGPELEEILRYSTRDALLDAIRR